MALSRVQYTGNGTGIYNVPFAYLSAAYVKVYVDGVLKTPDVDYSFLSASSIQFVVDPTGLYIDIRRETPDGVRLVDFQDGAILNEASLDLSADQVFHVVQEVKDAEVGKLGISLTGNYDAVGLRIENLADPLAAQDAVPLQWAVDGLAANVTTATAAALAATAASVATAQAAASAASASSVTAQAAATTSTGAQSATQGYVTQAETIFTAVSEAQAMTNAILGLGLGNAMVDEAGDLYLTTFDGSYQSVSINAAGNLILEY